MRKIKFLLPMFFTLLFSLSPSSICAAPGDLDSSFGQNGITYTRFENNTFSDATAVAHQPDGKIVAVGYVIQQFNTPRQAAIARYNADGTLDTSFFNGGRAVHFLGFSNVYTSVVVQPNGKILAAGSYNYYSGNLLVSNFLVRRYNTDGTLDNSFGNAGVVVTSFGDGGGGIGSIMLQADGKIVVAGGSGSSSYPNSFTLVRYNSDGSLDTSFDGDGKAVATFFDASYAYDLIIQPDGKFVLSGFTAISSRNSFSMMRFNADGSIDTGFGNNGVVVTQIGIADSFAYASAAQPDGKIILAGYSRNARNIRDYTLARYLPNGALDATFGSEGIVTTSFTNYTVAAYAVAVQSNGKIVAVGYNQLISSSETKMALARYNPNGSLDTSFGQAGRVETNFIGSAGFGASLDPNGKIVVVGRANVNFAVARFLGDAPASNTARFDFDGDGKSDLSVFRRGIWHLQRSQSGFNAVYWGIASDKLAPADFDGDGKTDVAVYRPSNGEWSILRSSDSTARILNFGIAEDLPRPADFDGDGKADIAVFRPSNGTWYRINSSSGQFSGTQFGQTGDVPLIADFDGDGKSDIAVFRPSNGTWYWLRSSDSHFIAFQFGSTEDAPVAADFDGDGKTDLSVYRPSNGTWYYLRSADGHFLAVQFGQAGDAATAGDYDGDGRAEMAVFRESNGVWYRLSSGNGGAFSYEQFGTSGDRPVPAAFLP